MDSFPDRFGSLDDARGFLAAFVTYYNTMHRHSEIGLHTPASVHDGTADHIRDRRQLVLDAAYAQHPERFTRRPRPPRIPDQATINDPAARSTETSQAQPSTARLI